MSVKVPSGASICAPYVQVPIGSGEQAIQLYSNLFGLKVTKKLVFHGVVANVHLGTDDQRVVIMLGEIPTEKLSPPTAEGTVARTFVHLFVDDSDRALNLARRTEGVTVVQELTDQMWGARDAEFIDPWGIMWNVSTFGGEDGKFYWSP
ncbi:hypothetical protein T439DRAFT_327941 [Meredithblackwellia eburnea MCA 4105]